jgi:hypothetical protein
MGYIFQMGYILRLDRPSPPSQFFFLSSLEDIMSKSQAIVRETKRRMDDVQAKIHNEILNCMSRDRENVERCLAVRKREKKLRNAISERQSRIVDSLEKFSKTVGT